jgi:enoyl-CoA hydratase/carnithine racemase
MSVRVVGLDVAELKALRKDPGYDGQPVILNGLGAGEDVGSVLAAVEGLGAPVVFVASGRLGAAGLALCSACVATFIGSEAEIGPIDPGDALALGLAGRLTDRVGSSAAARLLLDPRPTSQPVALGLVRVADDPLADARALAERLDAPPGRLLARSLDFAARSTTAQAAAYDAELLALLDQRDDPQTDR